MRGGSSGVMTIGLRSLNRRITPSSVRVASARNEPSDFCQYQPVKENTVEVRVDVTEVLVAATAIDLGAIANENLFRWQVWPKEAVSPSFITRSSPVKSTVGERQPIGLPSKSHSIRASHPSPAR